MHNHASALFTWALCGVVSVLALIYPSTGQAESCEDGEVRKDALCVEITGSAPDPTSREARWARGEVSRPMTRARYWDFFGPQGGHIMPGECWAVSPTVYIGRLGQHFFFASVSVGGTWDNPRIIVQSESGLEDQPTRFHDYKQNLGLWTESLPFQRINQQLGEHDILLGFDTKTSRRIVKNLARMMSFQLRLRFAPVDEAFDSPTITLNGFTKAYKQAAACNRQLANR